MLPEMLLLSGVRQHSRPLWHRTFPFHFGLYLTIGAIGVACSSGVVSSLVSGATAGNARDAIRIAVMGLGVVGLGLATLGALGLLHRRLTDSSLRRFTTAADILNLVLFVAVFGAALLTFALVDSDARLALEFAQNLVTFRWVPLPGEGLAVALPALTTILLSGLVAYVPLTHMSHFVGKYFAYHSIRWNDAPNLAGGPEEAKIHRLLAQKVSWAALHIRGEGRKSWADLAAENPTGSRS